MNGLAQFSTLNLYDFKDLLICIEHTVVFNGNKTVKRYEKGMQKGPEDFNSQSILINMKQMIQQQ